MNNVLLKGLEFLFSLLVLAVALALVFFFFGWPHTSGRIDAGLTFSRTYAQELGLDPAEVLRASLDDLGLKRFRIPVYWGIIEPERGRMNFEDVDADIARISEHDGRVILAIGEKVPRWPECWGPTWWKKLPRKEQKPLTLTYLETVVRRYRDTPTIFAWQVENEPNFSYGDCPKTDPDFLKQEIAFVRSLDPSRPVYTTDSGELSTWIGAGRLVDALGVSVYRVVRNPLLGNWNFSYWFLPPYFYHRKALFARIFGVPDVYVSEFQMEPWSNTPLPDTPMSDQIASMSLRQMEVNVEFARRMQVKAIDFWGVEWWFWMAKHGHPEYWRLAKKAFSEL